MYLYYPRFILYDRKWVLKDRRFKTVHVFKSFVQLKSGKRTETHCYSQTNLFCKVRLSQTERLMIQNWILYSKLNNTSYSYWDHNFGLCCFGFVFPIQSSPAACKTAGLVKLYQLLIVARAVGTACINSILLRGGEAQGIDLHNLTYYYVHNLCIVWTGIMQINLLTVVVRLHLLTEWGGMHFPVWNTLIPSKITRCILVVHSDTIWLRFQVFPLWTEPFKCMRFRWKRWEFAMVSVWTIDQEGGWIPEGKRGTPVCY